LTLKAFLEKIEQKEKDLYLKEYKEKYGNYEK
jgi:hypothetical protein